jgi:hypothetical protein
MRLRNHRTAAGNAVRIGERVGDGSMPPDRTLSENQVDRILRWVESGAPVR